MCLAIPMKVVEVNSPEGIVEAGGIRQSISLLLLDQVDPGDYVLVHAGYAIQKIDEEEAAKSLSLLYQITGEIPVDKEPDEISG